MSSLLNLGPCCSLTGVEWVFALFCENAVRSTDVRKHCIYQYICISDRVVTNVCEPGVRARAAGGAHGRSGAASVLLLRPT